MPTSSPAMLWLAALAVACGGDGADPGATDVLDTSPAADSDAAPPRDTLVDTELPPLSPLAAPCDHPAHFPFAAGAELAPIAVHYQRAEDQGMAVSVAYLLEVHWENQQNVHGFRPPVDDGGACGPNGAFDVFLWRGQEEAYVDVIGPNLATPHDDRLTYLVVDPWGPYGGDLLSATLAHELNHAMQAADDWWDAGAIYEMTATYIEALSDARSLTWAFVLEDFQQRPGWGLDHYDGYETWYMYGASLYLHYLGEAVFPDDPRFIGDMWLGLRSPPGADEDPALNEPDFVDALDALLAPDVDFVATVVDFARWRWFVADRDDGRHLSFAADLPDTAAVSLTATLSLDDGVVELSPGPMVLGSQYVRVTGPPVAAFTATADHAGDGAPAVAFVLQALPLPAEPLPTRPAPGAPLSTTLGADGERVLALTAVPTDEHDPDTRSAARFPITLTLTTP